MPGIGLEDSGEFATAAVTLTVTHPPGYPLYLLAGKLASVLPAGSPGFRLACFSAAAAGAAAVLIYGAARDILDARPAAAAGAAASLVWTPALLLQSSLSDKYPLALALFLLTAWLLWRAWWEAGRDLEGAALAGGLALAHHLMTLSLVPAVAGLAWRVRLWKWPGRTARLLLLAGLGISLKLVGLPLLSAPSSSLMYAPLNRAPALRRYLAGRDYEGRFAFSAAEKARRLVTHGLGELVRQYGGPGLLLAAAGATGIGRAAPGPLLAGVAAAAMSLWLIASFQIAGVGYYLLPVLSLAAFLAAAGLARIERALGSVAAAAAAFLLAGLAGRGLPTHNFSRYYGATDWGRNLLESLPRGAILVTQHDDDFYPPMYLQRVCGMRDDIILVHRPFLTRLWHHGMAEALHPGYAAFDRALIPWERVLQPEEVVNLFLRSHLSRRTVAFTYLANAETAGGFTLRPEGAAFVTGRPDTDPPLPGPAAFAVRMRRFAWRHVLAPWPAGSRLAEVAGAPATAWTQLAVRLSGAGRRDEARVALRRALAFPHTRVLRPDLELLARQVGVSAGEETGEEERLAP